MTGHVASLGLLVVLTSSCAPQGTFDFDVSDTAYQSPWPNLLSQGEPVAVLDAKMEPTADIAASAQDLAERATALRERAASMSGPVIPANDRARAAANP